jgi:hypothetical protein
MRPNRRLATTSLTIFRRAKASVVPAVAIALVLAASPTALGKEGMQARLDAPIARDAPGGTVLLVGMTVTVADGSVMRSVDGSPIYLRLFGPRGASTWELGRQDGTGRGHYTMRIVVPDGGVSRVEVGIHGTSDLAIEVIGQPVMAGGITGVTAQVAPAPLPAITPWPRASAAPPAPVMPATAQVARDPSVPALAALVALALALALALVPAAAAAIRRARSASLAASGTRTGPRPGAAPPAGPSHPAPPGPRS